jgi:hypothetical protein
MIPPPVALSLVAFQETQKLDDHSFLAVYDCLFNMFAFTQHIWKLSAFPFTFSKYVTCKTV